MKKLLVLLISMLLLPIAAFCQEIIESVTTIPGLDFTQCFATLAAFCPLVIFITEWIKKYIKVSGGLNQLFSWLISIGLAFVGWGLQLGMFAGIEWYVVIVYGIAAGLVCNGIFDIKLVQDILNAIFKKRLVS